MSAGEYASGPYFQVVAGSFSTQVTGGSGYLDIGTSGYAAGMASITAEMVEYIKANCQKGDKYVVTIKLYTDKTGSTPFMDNGVPVEFDVYVTF